MNEKELLKLALNRLKSIGVSKDDIVEEYEKNKRLKERMDLAREIESDFRDFCENTECDNCLFGNEFNVNPNICSIMYTINMLDEYDESDDDIKFEYDDLDFD